MILRADTIDLATRDQAVGGVARILDPDGDKLLAEHSIPGFREWYYDMRQGKVRPGLYQSSRPVEDATHQG